MNRRKAHSIAVGLVLMTGLTLVLPTPAADPPADPLSQANALSGAADKDRDAGQAEKALKEYQAAEALFKKSAGTNDTEDISNCLNNQATCLTKLGRDADALPLYKSALEIEQRLHKNQDDPELVVAISNEAECLLALDRPADALPLYESALKMQQRLSKEKDSADLASAMDDVARCLTRLDRDADALPLYKAAMELQQRLHENKDDADVAAAIDSVATCLDKLGKAHLHDGKPAEALPEFKEAADLFEKSKGTRETDEVTSSLNNEGLCLHLLNRDADALPIYQDVLKIVTKMNKDQDNPDTAIVLDNVADTLMNLGRNDEALPVREAELKMKKSLAQGKDDSEIASVEKATGFCLDAVGRYEDALVHFQAALDMHKRLNGNQDAADIVFDLNNVAKCEDALGRSEEALLVYQSGLEMARRLCKNQDNVDLATVMNNTAGCLKSLARGDEALALFQQSLDMRRRLFKTQDNPDIAASLNDLGVCQAMLGQTDQALQNVRASCEMLQRLNHNSDSEEVITALDNLGNCLDEYGRYAEALPNHASALAMAYRLYKHQDHPLLAQAMLGTGISFTGLGRHSDALKLNKRALEMLFRIYKDADHPDLVAAIDNYASSLTYAEQFDDAFGLYQAALKMTLRLHKNHDHPDVALNLGLLGGCLISLEKPADALPILLQALDMQSRIFGNRDHRVIAWHLHQIGLCLNALHRNQEALHQFQSAADMARRISDPDACRYESFVGESLASMGKVDEAVAAYKLAIDLLEQSRASLGGDDQDRMRFSNAQTSESDPYLGMVVAQLRLNRPDLAAEYLDRSRGRSLLDVLERGERQAGKDILAPVIARAEQSHDAGLLDQAKRAASDLAAADQNVQLLTCQVNIARLRTDSQSRATVDELQSRLAEACVSYTTAHRAAFKLIEPNAMVESVSATQMQAMLKPHEHMLMYVVTHNACAVIVVPPPGEPITAVNLTDPDRQTPLSFTALFSTVGEYERAILNQGRLATRGVRLVHDDATTTRASVNAPELGYQLFRRIIPNAVWEQIKSDDQVYVVPNWGISGLPFETLVVEPPLDSKAANCRYFLDRGPSLCYGASAAVLIKLRERKAPAVEMTHQAVLLGDPVFDRSESDHAATTAPSDRGASLGEFGSFAPLPGTRAEVNGIYGVLSGGKLKQQNDGSVLVLLGEDATRERLFNAATGSRYIHLATHGVALPGKDAIYSCIVLTQPRAGESQNTGQLTLQDLLDHWGGKLTGTELVVLSACNSLGDEDTAAGMFNEAISDQGVFGLPWGFWYAGCPTVVASLWEVQDDSTAKLMQGFYKQLKATDGRAKLAAFTAARKELKKEYPEPFFWAPFIYLGNPN